MTRALPRPELLWLGARRCGDPALTGRKAALLSALAADFPVPPGFCVPMPDGAPSIGAAYAELAERLGRREPAVAVRASALEEDAALASLAGPGRTLLNVCGAAAVSAAAAACAQAHRSPEAGAYRRRRGLPETPPVVPVLVQELIAADAAAVVSGADELRVAASWGLGASITRGTVTPDAYVLAREGLRVLEQRIADKRRMTVRARAGVREIDVPASLRRLAALREERVREAAALAVAVEAHVGFRVAIECAWAEGRVALLACRLA